jgi:hypothetical protein
MFSEKQIFFSLVVIVSESIDEQRDNLMGLLLLNLYIVAVCFIVFYLLPLIHDINRRGVLDTTLHDKVSQ